jgi:hypothetical protein
VEKLAESGNERVEAVREQIARLEDMKDQIPEDTPEDEAESAGEEEREGVQPREIPTGGPLSEDEEAMQAAIDVALLRGYKSRPVNNQRSYWEGVVRPELVQVSRYLKKAGIEASVPYNPGDETREGIVQTINVFINKLIDLGEILTREATGSTLAQVPGE